MNLRFVEAFHWAVSLGGVTRAAEKLHLTQSALSSRIASLEQELGVVLLDRRERQFRLTNAGQRFHLLAVQLLDMQRQVKEEMGSKGDKPVSLRIGAIESVVHTWLAGWLQEMRRTQPDFALELTVETSPVLVDQVKRGALDLVFAAIPGTSAGVRSQQLPSMPLVFVGHAQLHQRPRYTLAHLAALDLLTFQRGSHPHQSLRDLFERRELALPHIHAISSISAMVQLVEAGFGVATLPAAAAAQLAQRAPLRILRVDAALDPLPLHASYREDPGSKLTESVLGAALSYLSSNTLAKPGLRPSK